MEDWKTHAVSHLVGGVLLIILLWLPAALVAFLFCAVLHRALALVWPRYARLYRFREILKKYLAEKREYEAWLLRRAVEFWRSLSGVAFERELGALFRRMGYAVTTTPATGDGGVDLIRERGGRRTVVQCKAHASKIGISTARQLVASMIDFQAHEGIIAATSGVTKPVSEYIKGKNIQVYDLSRILSLQRRLE